MGPTGRFSALYSILPETYLWAKQHGGLGTISTSHCFCNLFMRLAENPYALKGHSLPIMFPVYDCKEDSLDIY